MTEAHQAWVTVVDTQQKLYDTVHHRRDVFQNIDWYVDTKYIVLSTYEKNLTWYVNYAGGEIRAPNLTLFWTKLNYGYLRIP